ncbi:hypothetical protein [Vibrio brasiliensis]|jgi:DNA-binding protein H-NS|nr:hypothetical protein [Vibrio brasiliensis]
MMSMNLREKGRNMEIQEQHKILLNKGRLRAQLKHCSSDDLMLAIDNLTTVIQERRQTTLNNKLAKIAQRIDREGIDVSLLLARLGQMTTSGSTSQNGA